MAFDLARHFEIYKLYGWEHGPYCICIPKNLEKISRRRVRSDIAPLLQRQDPDPQPDADLTDSGKDA